MNITDSIRYIGVNDREIDLFEGHYDVPNGMAYNSYVILDDKIAVMDSVDANFGEEWLKNLADALGGRKPDYLIIQHMEPDHSANIGRFVEAYPDAVLVGNAKTFAMLGQFFPEMELPADKKLTVKDGKPTVEIIWSSNKYDYMVVDGEKIDPVSVEEFSVFEIPVLGFDYKMPVSADTTAMSTPHEIEYTLYFDSSSIAS